MRIMRNALFIQLLILFATFLALPPKSYANNNFLRWDSDLQSQSQVFLEISDLIPEEVKKILSFVQIAKLEKSPEALPLSCQIDSEQQVASFFWPSFFINEKQYNAHLQIDISRKTIRVSKALMALFSSSEKLDCSPYSHSQLARIALVKALFEIYDNQKVWLGYEAEAKKYCLKQPLKTTNSKVSTLPQDPFCTKVGSFKYSISDSLFFQNLTDQTVKGFSYQYRSYDNLSPRSFPNERLTPQVLFAQRAALYILDPEFSCRNPSVNSYFNQTWKESRGHCQPGYKIKIRTSETKEEIVDLDPRRLYEVQYLFASAGQSTISQFGHSMFRLIYCAPGKPLGPDCMNDMAYHIVVSAYGYIDELKLSPIKGIIGDYASYLTISPVNFTRVQYNSLENRDLISYPLKFSEIEKVRFAQRVVEKYWSYWARYSFMDNNCATESLNLIKAALMRQPRFLSANVSTPVGLKQLLIQEGIAIDPLQKYSKEEARYLGYVYLSEEQNMKLLIDAVKTDFAGLLPAKAPHTIVEYFEMYTEKDIYHLVNQLPVCADMKCVTQISQLQRLESLRAMWTESSLLKWSVELLQKWQKKPSDYPISIQDDLKKLQEFLSAQVSPANNVPMFKSKGYGVPTQQEQTDSLGLVQKSIPATENKPPPSKISQQMQLILNVAQVLDPDAYEKSLLTVETRTQLANKKNSFLQQNLELYLKIK